MGPMGPDTSPTVAPGFQPERAAPTLQYELEETGRRVGAAQFVVAL
jgi:hypothetical protein